MIKYIIIIIIIISLYIIFKINNNNKFWNNQPIIFKKNNKFGKNNLTKNILNTNRMIKDGLKLSFLGKKDFKLIINFLNSNYEDNFNYNINLFNWHMNSLNNNYFIPCLIKNNTIIGLITGKIINMTINNILYKVLYVDFLCIKKEYRANEYALDLINECFKYMDTNNISFAIFKKDYKKLYVDNYIKYKVYYKKVELIKNNLNYNNIYLINKKNINLIYNFFYKINNNYNINHILTIDEFKLLINNYNDLVYCYYEIDSNNNIINMIIYLKIYMSSINEYICNIIFIIDNNNFLSKLKKNFEKQNIKYIYLDNTMNNSKIIKNYNFDFNYNCYLYFLNFNISNIFNNKDISIKL